MTGLSALPRLVKSTVIVSFIVGAAWLVSGCSEPAPAVDWDQWDSPAAEYRPWVRWWWPGNDVDDDEISREVALLAASFFGGAELNSFNAALDWDADEAELARRLDWGSDLFWSRVRLAAESAGSHGIALDLNVGSGWPVGGAGVTAAESMKTLLWSEVFVTGPKKVALEFTTPGPDPFYEVAAQAEAIGEPMARYLPEMCEVVEVVAARKTGGSRNQEFWDLTDQVTLDRDSVVVLTDLVSSEGGISWDVPEGDWAVIGFYVCPDGQYVNLNAYPEQRDVFVVDQFDETAVRATNDALCGVEAGLDDLFGGAIRGVFVDSFELKTERHFTDDFFAEFQTRRGYDLRPWLPAVVAPGADNNIFDGAGIANRCPFGFGELDSRVARDYQQTVSDLFIERYVGGNVRWASENGLRFRIQPYGLQVDSIRAAGMADVPETEQLYAGGTELALKVVASGAHQYGRPTVSAESLVSAGRDYMTTPTKMRAWLDKLFSSGVNSVVYHGFPYQTGLEKYGDTDWHAFSSPFSGLGTYSENMSEANPFWPFMNRMNQYVARVQYMLRQGTPRADVLVYYPWMGVPASLVSLHDHQEALFKGQFGDESAAGQDSMLALVQGLFGGFKPSDATWWVGAAWPVLSEIENLGYTWEWTNDDVLSRATVKDGRLVSADASYGAVVVMRTPWMSAEAAGSLAAMAAAGLPVVVLGDAPVSQPGLADHVAGDAAVVAAFESMKDLPNVSFVPVVQIPPADSQANPQLFSAEGFAAGLMTAGCRPAFDVSSRGATVRTMARDVDGGRIWFVRNPSDQDQTVVVTPDVDCADGMVLDPMDGSVAALDVRAGGDFELPVMAWTSSIVLCGFDAPADSAERFASAPVRTPAVDDFVITDWSLSVTGDDVTGGEFEKQTDALGDWRDIPELKYSSSGGVYTATFDFPFDPYEFDVPTPMRRSFYLDLGQVHGAVLVSVNGVGATPVIAEPFRIDVTSSVVSGPNQVVVMLVPPLRNRLVGLGLAKDPTAAQFEDKKDTVIATGLIGPVTLEELASEW